MAAICFPGIAQNAVVEQVPKRLSTNFDRRNTGAPHLHFELVGAVRFELTSAEVIVARLFNAARNAVESAPDIGSEFFSNFFPFFQFVAE
jgi:hypothetical protein